MNTNYLKETDWKRFVITVMRMVVGWHFLYEGITKLMADNWTAASYLSNSVGFMSWFYKWLASSPVLLGFVDFMNIAGLIAIGLCLYLGTWTRISAALGALLLMLYYFTYPPFGAAVMFQPEGSLFIVNKQLIEAIILLLYIFMTDRGWGIDRLRFPSARKDATGASEAGDRRQWIKNLASIPVLGLVGFGAERNHRKYGTDIMSGATIKLEKVDISELKGELPMGKIGDHEISRLVLGGNLIGGWAHARDLIYVSSLFKAYNSENKVFETLALAEQAGINTINIGFPSNPLLQKYKKVTGSKIKVISQVNFDRKKPEDLYGNINIAIEHGADILQIQGNGTDVAVRDGKIDLIADMNDYIKRQGFTCGLGAHSIAAMEACEQEGIVPDYYMKTMHHDNYWSAHPRENRSDYEVMGGVPKKHRGDRDYYNNNLWCSYPERTIAFVNRVKVPVMGYKVLAAGAIQPEDGFRWAFENGADFICVGMFDFQVVKNVNTTLSILNSLEKRQRGWFA